MHKVRAWLVICCCVFVNGCMFDSIGGSGKIVSEPRPVSGFSKVSLGGSGQVVIEQTGTESLTVTTDDNLLPYIKTEVHGDTLELGTKDLTNVNPTDDIIFKLTVKKLEGLQVSGSGTADARGITQDRIEFKISGSGEVRARGTTDDLNLSISGSGDYRGEDMKAKRATVAISGSGRALLVADEQLSANVSGSGSIEYTGNPQLTQHISGSGSVRRR